MTRNAFDHMTRQLVTGAVLPPGKVSRDEYEVFCKEYLFDNLREESFGRAFCKRFDITDYVLDILPSEQSAKLHITSFRYVED